MKYEYMKESEPMLQYFQFPKFLLKLRISQTAKFLYMILYDRARISRKNSWIDKVWKCLFDISDRGIVCSNR